MVPLFSFHTDAAECGTGKRPLYFAVDPNLVNFLPGSFPSKLLKELDLPLQEIGYCITNYTPLALRDSMLQNELIMMLSMKFDVTTKTIAIDGDNLMDENVLPVDSIENDTIIRLIVSTIHVRDWSSLERRKALANPLLSLVYSPDEIVTFTSVLIKKIIENLRIQYICHLRIESVPDGVTIASLHGLEGTTPLEWITPVGVLPIIGQLEGFELIQRTIDLATPGNHTYVLQMRQEQVYNSRFFVPSVVAATSSAASFFLMYYFKSRYDALGKNTKDNNPALFKKTFTTARTFQICGYSLLSAAVGSFTLSFFY